VRRFVVGAGRGGAVRGDPASAWGMSSDMHLTCLAWHIKLNSSAMSPAGCQLCRIVTSLVGALQWLQAECIAEAVAAAVPVCLSVCLTSCCGGDCHQKVLEL
jgi:hypothetical protein